MTSRPLDVLDVAKGKKIIVKLKNGHTISGVLKAFDLHLNMWLEEAELDNKESKMKFGKLLVRGDNIVLVSPE
jgi:small nuclear ribonucleoprotein